jgi:ACS family glucarate transporter-like MFS transporter
VSRQEAEHIRSGLLSDAAAKPGSAKLLSWGTILKNRNVQALTVSYFTFGYSAYIFYSWFFIYLNTVRGLDLRSSAVYSMLPFISMASGSLLGGFICDRVTKPYGRRLGRCGIAAVGLGLAAIFIALGTQAQDARLASIILAGGAGAVYLSQSSYWSVTADIAGASAGSVSGVMNMGAQIGGAITASLTPLIAQHFGWSASFLTAAVLCVVGSLAWLVVNPERELAR